MSIFLDIDFFLNLENGLKSNLFFLNFRIDIGENLNLGKVDIRLKYLFFLKGVIRVSVFCYYVYKLVYFVG